MNGWLLWMAVAATGRYQASYTLEDLLQLALQRNQTLQAAKTRVRSQSWKRLPALSLPSPMVGYMWDPTDAPWNRQGWVISQTVPFPLKLWSRYRVQEGRVHQAEAMVRSVEAQLLRDVEMAYHDLQFAVAWDSLIEGYLEVLQGARKVSASRYRTGMRPLKEPVRWQLEWARLEAERSVVRALQEDALQRLHSMLRLQEPLDPRLLVPVDSLRLPEGVLEEAPGIQQARARQEVAEAFSRLKFWSVFPDVRIQAQTMERMGMVMWGAMLTVPLFLPFREAPAWQASRLSAKASQLETAQIRQDLAARFEGMRVTWNALWIRDSLLQSEVLPGAEAFFSSVEAAFRSGGAGYLEFLDAYRELYRARKEWLQNRRELGYLHARMEALLGYPSVLQGGKRP